MSARLSTGAPARLLGRHVGRGAEDHPELRPVDRGQRRRVERSSASAPDPPPTRSRDRIHRLRQAEVEDLDLAFAWSLDVLGLQIAVNDALLVGLFQRLGDLTGDGEAFIEGQRLRTPGAPPASALRRAP